MYLCNLCISRNAGVYVTIVMCICYVYQLSVPSSYCCVMCSSRSTGVYVTGIFCVVCAS